MSGAYYNEHDPKAAAWLRELVRRDLIAPGDVDERSILDIRPDELTGYTQCHFFAGIGVWSYALRRAGWPDDRPVWTGSCPCQPFSAAGKGGGFDDERHLWPAWHWLIGERRPGVVFGEQVASRDGLAWLDLVRVDMEAEGYAIGAVDLCAAGFGAPHIRQRIYFCAERVGENPTGVGRGRGRDGSAGGERGEVQAAGLRGAGELADAAGGRRQPIAAIAGVSGAGVGAAESLAELGDLGQSRLLADADERAGQREVARAAERAVSEADGRPDRLDNAIQPGLEGLGGDGDDGDEPGRDGAGAAGSTPAASESGSLADAAGVRRIERRGGPGAEIQGERAERSREHAEPGDTGELSGGLEGLRDLGLLADAERDGGRADEPERGAQGRDADGRDGATLARRPGATNGFWRDADWIRCRDGRWRPVEPGSTPLAHGAPARMGRLRGYGNAINAEVAKGFIQAYMKARGE